MAWFIFVGDMLVMGFMTVVVVWVSAGANRETLDYSARIPLDDDTAPAGSVAKEAGQHG